MIKCACNVRDTACPQPAVTGGELCSDCQHHQPDPPFDLLVFLRLVWLRIELDRVNGRMIAAYEKLCRPWRG